MCQFLLVISSSSYQTYQALLNPKTIPSKDKPRGKRTPNFGCEYASLSFFYPSLFLIQIIHLFQDSSAFVLGRSPIHKFQGQIKVGEAVIAFMCNLSFLLFFFSNLPAPLNLNESLSSGKGKPYNPQQVQGRIREILGKYSNGFWVSKLPQIYRELYKQDLPTEAIKDLETWTHICTVCTHVPVVIC